MGEVRKESMNYGEFIKKVKKVFLKFNLLIVILIVLLLGNYLYTFSGFVVYTETERRGCALLENFSNFETVEQKNEKFNELTEENKKIVNRYFHQFETKRERCKPIQQFYLEQGFIVLLGTVLVLRKKIFINNAGKK